MRHLLALALLALCVSCAHAPPPPPSEAERLTPKVKALADAAQGLLRAQDEAVWKSWTEGVPLDLGKTYVGKDALFTPEAIHAIDRLRVLTKDPREARALGHLESYFIGEHLSRQTQDLSEAIANLTASLTFSLDGRVYPYRDLERLLANEKSSVRRRQFYVAATPAVERLTELERRREERLSKLLDALGTSYAAFGAQLREADLAKLRGLAEALLEVTEKPYLAVMDRLAEAELKTPFNELTRSDLGRLFRPESVDQSFPKDQLWPRTAATAAGLGIELAHLPGLTLDLAERKEKNRRGLTLAVAPGDVRVSLEPEDGVRQQLAFLHELGHVLADVFTEEKDFRLAKLGDPAVAETFAFLFEDLGEDPVWLAQQANLTGEPAARFLATASARKLFLVRRAAGRLLFALALQADPNADPEALFVHELGRAYGIRLTAEDGKRALLDQEDFFQSADLLRSWMLAAQLEAQLKARFGPSWWRSRDAGAFLKTLWRAGNAHSPDQLARDFGDAGLDPAALLLQLGTSLGVPLTLPARPSADAPRTTPSPSATPAAPPPTTQAPAFRPTAAQPPAVQPPAAQPAAAQLPAAQPNASQPAATQH